MRSKSGLFRAAALERLSSPERVDQLLQVLPKKQWPTVFALLILVGGVVVWSFFGSIPIRVEGKGFLVPQGSSEVLEASATGLITSLVVAEGDFIQRGQAIGFIDQADVQQQLRHEQQKLEQLDQRQGQERTIEQQQVKIELKGIVAQRQRFNSRLKTLSDSSLDSYETNVKLMSRNRTLLEKQIKTALRLIETLATLYEREKKLFAKGLIIEDQLLETEVKLKQAIDDHQSRNFELNQVAFKTVEAERLYRERLDNCAAMRDSLLDLKLQEQKATQRVPQLRMKQENERLLQLQSIEQLTLTISRDGLVKSPYSGRVLELRRGRGQTVTQGQVILTLEAQEGQTLECVAYFPVADGKRIEEGMRVLVSPDSIQQERFGSINGSVTMVATYPVSVEAATRHLGEKRLATTLLGADTAIEIRIALNKNDKTPSGYEWSSSDGPPTRVESGNTTAVFVSIEQRAPATFILPLLREWTGL